MPYIASAQGHPTDATKIRVTFNEAMNPAGFVAANFSLPPVTITAAAAVAGSNNTQVDLTFTGTLERGESYTLTATGLASAGGTPLSAPDNTTGLAYLGLNGVMSISTAVMGSVSIYYAEPAPFVAQKFNWPISGDVREPNAPVIENVTTPGPVTRNTVIEFDAKDDKQVARVFIAIKFPATGQYEVAYDGTEFSTLYAQSQRSEIDGGFHFAVQRTGGWPSEPVLCPQVLDTSGNLNQ